ncbi:ABC transporter permease [Swaminathania salitolerans]|uniref:Sugar ABC transporter permease n=1 Tax=Swaminathania salitolerans TaxID=182838 RepID=A0A511BLG0_9PROT|nr:ABC transporter permease [Swaminathania salitolerans]GBQ09884.1 polysaccharide/O-antigen exporter permease [Swaminathania salitolerans LMG 21291]GEL01085.1 sugar ABC transporter permease [Swaminathania salitolerans]
MIQTRTSRAWDDLVKGLASWRLAVSLGRTDISLRYRGSVLGPFWLTLSSLIMVAAMGGIYARLFHMVLRDYLPFLALSLALWQVGLASIIQESCTCFIDAASTIHAMRLPFTLHVIRLLVRNAIVFAHSIVVPIGVFVLYGVWPGLMGLASIPGLLLWLLDGFAACLLLGALCARFRDIPPIVAAFLQIAFYVTPVIWQPSQLGPRSRYLVANPFYDLMELVRAPILGHWPSPAAIVVALALSAIWCALGFLTFVRTRDRLAFWV